MCSSLLDETEKHVIGLSLRRHLCQVKEPQRKSQERQRGEALMLLQLKVPACSNPMRCFLTLNSLILRVADVVQGGDSLSGFVFLTLMFPMCKARSGFFLQMLSIVEYYFSCVNVYYICFFCFC